MLFGYNLLFLQVSSSIFQESMGVEQHYLFQNVGLKVFTL
jgi:hypothetical protein